MNDTSYDNAKHLVESLIHHRTNIKECISYIEENYKVNSIYDSQTSSLYIWGNDNNIYEAKNYVLSNINEGLIEIFLMEPDNEMKHKLFEAAQEETVYVVYFNEKDPQMYDYFFNKDEANDAVEKLKKESKDNKPIIKEEPLSNFVKE